MTDHPESHPAIASQLRAGARVFASAAAEMLLDGGQDAQPSTVSGSYRLWHDFLSQRVVELATAVELAEPRLFGADVRWQYETLKARDIGAGDIAASLRCLQASLGEELSPSAFECVAPSISAADAAETGSPVGARLECTGDHERLALAFLERALQGRGDQAVGLITKAASDGTPVRDLYERVLLVAQAELGTMWQFGEIGIAEEHAGTESVRAAMFALWQTSLSQGRSGPTVIVGSVSGDTHDAGVRAAAHLLDLAGCRATCLGADLPSEEFAIAAQQFEADAAVISATMTVHLPRVGEACRAMRSIRPGMRIVVGGPAFDRVCDLGKALATKLGADAYAPTPSAAADQVIALVSSS